MQHLLFALTLGSALISLPAVAQADNRFGALASDSMPLGMDVPLSSTRIKISGLESFVFDFNKGGDLPRDQSQDVCVYITTDTTYTVTLSAPLLTDQSETYPYSIDYTDINDPNLVLASGTIDTVPYNGSLSGFSASSVLDCTDGSNTARVSVGFPADLKQRAATSGATANVRLTVTPD